MAFPFCQHKEFFFFGFFFGCLVFFLTFLFVLLLFRFVFEMESDCIALAYLELTM